MNDSISRRDYFTAAAMQGLLAHYGHSLSAGEIGERAVKCADVAMFKVGYRPERTIEINTAADRDLPTARETAEDAPPPSASPAPAEQVSGELAAATLRGGAVDSAESVETRGDASIPSEQAGRSAFILDEPAKKPRKARTPQPCRGPDCSIVPVKVVAFCGEHATATKAQRNQWIVDAKARRAAEKNQAQPASATPEAA